MKVFNGVFSPSETQEINKLWERSRKFLYSGKSAGAIWHTQTPAPRRLSHCTSSELEYGMTDDCIVLISDISSRVCGGSLSRFYEGDIIALEGL